MSKIKIIVKKIILFLIIIYPAGILKAASTLTSPDALRSGESSVDLSTDVFVDNMNYALLPALRFRIGIPDIFPFGDDAGLLIYYSGIIADIKKELLSNNPFMLTSDLEAGYTGLTTGNELWEAGVSLYFRVEMTQDYHIYIASRWRWPALEELDTCMVPFYGTEFSLHPGMEFSINENLSLIADTGIAFGSITNNVLQAPVFSAAAMLRWKMGKKINKPIVPLSALTNNPVATNIDNISNQPQNFLTNK